MDNVDFQPREVDTFGAGPNGPMVKIITINDKKFVSGLYWKPLTNPRKYMSEARAFGKKQGWDIVAIRKGVNRIQAGFVGKNDGALKGMYSLAATLAGMLGDEWIGAFALPNDYYAVVATHEGSIVPGYDVICRREEAIEKVKEGYNLFNFKPEHTYAPADFDWAERSIDLFEMLSAKALRKDYRLQTLSFGFTTRELATIGVGILLLGGAGYGVKMYFDQLEQKRLDAQRAIEIQRQAELKRLNENSKRKQEEEALKHPWASVPGASDFVKACRDQYRLAWSNIAGWPFQDAECATDSQTLKLGYQRPEGGATSREFADRVLALYDVMPAFSSKGYGQITLALKVPFGGDEELTNMSDLKLDVLSHFQAHDVEVAIGNDEAKTLPPAVAPIAGQVVAAAPVAAVIVPPWKRAVFSYSSSYPPTVDFVELSRFAGIRVKKVTVNYSTNGDETLKWTVTGDLYGN